MIVHHHCSWKNMLFMPHNRASTSFRVFGNRRTLRYKTTLKLLFQLKHRLSNGIIMYQTYKDYGLLYASLKTFIMVTNNVMVNYKRKKLFEILDKLNSKNCVQRLVKEIQKGIITSNALRRILLQIKIEFVRFWSSLHTADIP